VGPRCGTGGCPLARVSQTQVDAKGGEEWGIGVHAVSKAPTTRRFLPMLEGLGTAYLGEGAISTSASTKDQT